MTKADHSLRVDELKTGNDVFIKISLSFSSVEEQVELRVHILQCKLVINEARP